MKTIKFLLTITFLTLSLISSAQHALGAYAPGGYYDQMERKKQAEIKKKQAEFLFEIKMNNRLIKAKERLTQGKSISKSQQEALVWNEARINKRKSDSIKKSEEELAIKLKDERQIAENNRIMEEKENYYKENERTYYEFATSYLENYKIKYRDSVIKRYRENGPDESNEYNVKGDLDKEYEKAYNMPALDNTEKFNRGTIRKVMNEIEDEFRNSKEYKDGEARKNSKLRAQVAELNKAQQAYNYNMTHLEKFSTPKLREMYMYFRDKSSFQAEAELVRVELLRRK